MGQAIKDKRTRHSPFWSGDRLPLGRSRTFSSDSLNTVRNFMTDQFCDHSLRTEGGSPPLHFKHNHLRLQSLSFHATDYGMPFGKVALTIPSIEDICLVQFSLSGTARIVSNGQEIELKRGELCVLNSKAPVSETFDHDYRHLTVRIPMDRINTVLRQELGRSDLSFEPVMQSTRVDGAAAAFGHLVRTICDDLDAGVTAYRHERAAEVVEDTLTRLLLASVPHRHAQDYNAPRTSPAPYYIRRIEKYLREVASIDEPITLDTLVDVSGVKARTLHASFRRFRSVTPMTYVKNYRLDTAHQRLREAAGKGAGSVTEIAMMCGFNHLSKFAHDYRERFGQLPSDTLKGLGAFGR